MDDLQYYSTENLAENRSYDEGVRKYLERLPSSNKSNGTMTMTRSTTPVTMMTMADVTHDASRPETPNGLLDGTTNGRATSLTEPDSRSMKSGKGGSPYSNRKAYSERPNTPSSIAQYSDGVYIGPVSRNENAVDTLERSPKMRQKQYKHISQPAIHSTLDRNNSNFGTLNSNYQTDATSAPNVAYMTNKSNRSTSSEASVRSNHPLQSQEYSDYSQQATLPRSVSQQQQHPHSGTSYGQQPQVVYQQIQPQPIQQPIIQSQQIFNHQKQPHHELGIPLLPISQTTQQAKHQPNEALPDPNESGPQKYSRVPQSEPSPNDFLQPTQVPNQQPAQQYQQSPNNLIQETHASNNKSAVLPVQQPQPLPRSTVPSDNGDRMSTPTDVSSGNSQPPMSRSRPITPSSMVLEISMKNSKSSIQGGKVINTEL